jgi:hypothetical protein
MALMAALRLLALVPAAASALRMHEIHSTITEVTQNGSAVELRIRVFADDLSAAVALRAGSLMPRDSSVALPALDDYVRSAVALVDETGAVRPLERCGFKREGEAYLLCYRSGTAGRARAITVRQELLNERHRDQVNVVRVAAFGSRRTLVLTRLAPTAAAWQR